MIVASLLLTTALTCSPWPDFPQAKLGDKVYYRGGDEDLNTCTKRFYFICTDTNTQIVTSDPDITHVSCPVTRKRTVKH